MRRTLWILCLLLTSATLAFAKQPPTAHWELDRVDTIKYVKNPVYKEYPANPILHTAILRESRVGYCQGVEEFDYTKEKSRNVSRPFWIQWKAGPKTAQPGEVWDIHFETDKGKANRVAALLSKPGTDPDQTVDETFVGPLDRTPRLKFPQPVPGKVESVIAVVAVGVIAQGDFSRYVRHIDYGDVDFYVYRYRWVEPRQVTGTLKIHARSPFGPVQGATFRVKNRVTGERTEIVTDKQGEAQKDFAIETLTEPLEVEVLEAVLGPATKLSPTTGSVLFSRKTPPIAIGKVIKLPDRQAVTLEWKLPAFKLVLFVYRWDEAQRQWLGCPATVVVGGPKVGYLKIPPDQFHDQAGKLSAEVLVPGLESLQTPWLQARGFEDKDKTSGLVRLKVTRPPSKLPVIATLNLCDKWAKLRRIRMQIRDFFSDPAFHGVVDAQQAQTIAGLEVVLDPKASKPISTLDGRTTVQSGSYLETDESENADTLTHEWTHHTMQLMAPDPDIAGELGYPHLGGFFQLNGSPEMAWDEGRAHFCGSLLNLAMEAPNNSDQLSPKNSEQWVKENPTVTTPGNRNEGMVASALLDYYRRAGFHNTREVYADFLQIHRFAQQTQGHPPRTMDEFVDLVKAFNDQTHGQRSQAMNQAADQVRVKYQVR